MAIGYKNSAGVDLEDLGVVYANRYANVVSKFGTPTTSDADRVGGVYLSTMKCSGCAWNCSSACKNGCAGGCKNGCAGCTNCYNGCQGACRNDCTYENKGK